MVKTSLSDDEPKVDTRSAPKEIAICGPSKRRFDEIYNKGRRFRGDFLTFIALSGSGLIGVATSKKLGEKPQRNRQKRRIKAALAFSSKLKSMDIVIVASGKTNQAEFATLQQECAQKIGEIERWGGE